MIVEEIEIINLNFERNIQSSMIKIQTAEVVSTQNNITSRHSPSKEHSTKESKYNTNRNTNLNNEQHANPITIRR